MTSTANSFARSEDANSVKGQAGENHRVRPILKWAGGKQQMLPQLLANIPVQFNKYIEPFFGGGALFFALEPSRAIIADANPELVNLYNVVANDVENLISCLGEFQNQKEYFYHVRSQDTTQLTDIQKAARTIYLNRTCFNGLYRVNRSGQFNVPFGSYQNPAICRPQQLRAASHLLRSAHLICGDYKKVLQTHAKPDDLIFLDPPYLPVSKYSDFKRYTKEQFYEEDHQDLAKEVQRLHRLGCHVLLTNSNHPLVHELYDDFNIKVFQTRRNISKNSLTRTGEDVLISIPPFRKKQMIISPPPMEKQVEKYPSTRYMGSKQSILPNIWQVVSQFPVHSVLDLFSGSGVVGYMFKAQGKQVYANDFMAMGATFTHALIENNRVTLTDDDIQMLLQPTNISDDFVATTFKNLYFSDAENQLIDTIRANIKTLKDKYKQSLATGALMRALIKKRPRGIFTYTGQRYNDGRRDLQITLKEHFELAAQVLNNAVFDNSQKNVSRRGDAMTVKWKPDLVYMDPPYYSPYSDNDYVRRYHLLEGIACDWKGLEIQQHTKTKKFKSYPSPFSSRVGAHDAFDKLFNHFKDSILVISYSSNSMPTRDEILSLMSKYKKKVEVISIDYRYSFANQGHKVSNNKNKVQEYIFLGY